MGIDFGGADAGVAEQFLDDAQVRAVFEQVRGKAMPEHVGRHVARDAGAADALLDPQPEGDRRKGGAALGEEHIGG